MAVLFAEGFTGLPVNNVSSLSTGYLDTMGYVVDGRTNTTSGLSAAYTVGIEADDIFADRRQLRFGRTSAAPATNNFWINIRKPFDVSGHQKFVIGGMAKAVSSVTTGDIYLIFSDSVAWASSIPSNNLWFQLRWPANGTSGAVHNGPGAVQYPSDKLVIDQWVHFEVLIEPDVNRIRVYLDGVLSYDDTRTFYLSVNPGVTFTIYMAAPINATNRDVKLSNLYILGVDDVHTGPLGPATRILEVAPPTDLEVEWKRPTSFSQNAEVLSQYFNATSPAYLTASEPLTDLYTGIDAVAANAAEVYGAALKVRAQSMAIGTHTITGVTKAEDQTADSSQIGTLALATPNAFSFDLSINPATEEVWEPAEVTTAGFGFRLIQ